MREGAKDFYDRPPLFTHTVWKGNEENDIRNSNSNILRKWCIGNADSQFYNDTLDFNKPASDWLKYF